MNALQLGVEGINGIVPEDSKALKSFHKLQTSEFDYQTRNKVKLQIHCSWNISDLIFCSTDRELQDPWTAARDPLRAPAFPLRDAAPGCRDLICFGNHLSPETVPAERNVPFQLQGPAL